MDSHSSKQPNIFFCAVGGTNKVRQSRASLLSTLSIKPSYYVPSEVEAWPFPNWIEQLNIRTDQSPRPLNESFRSDDIILMVGKVNEEELIKQIGTAAPIIFLQGPGFNYGGFGPSKDKHMQNLSRVSSKMINIEGDDCYAYEYKEMNALCDQFPSELRELRTYQVGGFWATRKKNFLRKRNGTTSGAFYRQFGMTEKISRGLCREFEINIARNAGLKRIAQQIEALENPGTDANAQQSFFEQVYDIYKQNTLTSQQVAALSVELLKASSAEDAVVKEYDGLVAHVMLRSLAGFEKEIPTKEEHMDLMRACVAGEDTDAVRALRAQVHHRHRIFVFHDLGMDPQNDDWIAINIVKHILGPYNQSTSAQGIFGGKRKRNKLKF